jgi:xyloglucan-specific exo-beta-1,4-glucanase
MGAPGIYESQDGGATWAPVPGQNTTFISHHGVLAPAEKSLYVTYVNRTFPRLQIQIEILMRD